MTARTPAERTDEALDSAQADRAIGTALDALRLDPRPAVEDLPRVRPSSIPADVDGALALSRIGRLLVRKGDPGSLRTALGASFLLQEIEDGSGAGRARSSLLRGLARIGLGQIETGLVSVTRFMECTDEDADPEGAVLARWGLVTVALAFRDVGLAARLTTDCRKIADRRSLRAHAARAGRLSRLLEALAGSGPFPARSDEPLPLLLGLDPGGPGQGDTGEAAPGSFGDLCRARRTWPGRDEILGLGADELAALAGLLGRWNVARPFGIVAERLREVDRDGWFRLLLGRSMGKRAAGRVEADSSAAKEAIERRDAVAWMTDVVGYAALSESVPPETLFEALTPLFRVMNEELEEAGGMILEFMGDSILVVFGAFEGREIDHAEILRRTATCLDRIRTHAALSHLTGSREVSVGVGMARGQLALGYLGGLERCHLSTLGNTVNVAASMKSLTRKLPSSVAIHESLFSGEDPAPWKDPHRANHTLRDLGSHWVKNISRPLRVYGISPLVPTWVEFVPAGLVAVPEPGVVYLDSGNLFARGVIDHHAGPGLGHSVCEIVVTRPSLVLRHLVGVPRSRIEFRLHEGPDMDCVASYYAACELVSGRTRRGALRALASYLSRIDQGIFPDRRRLLDSPYAIFMAHQALAPDRAGARPRDPVLLEAGLRVVDAAVFLAHRRKASRLDAIFRFAPGWFPEEREWLARNRGTLEI